MVGAEFGSRLALTVNLFNKTVTIFQLRQEINFGKTTKRKDLGF